MDAAALIDTYCLAWSTPSPEARAAHLAQTWAPGATYTDPTAQLVGAAELLAHIARVMEARPGLCVRRTSAVDLHHGAARFAWQAVGADGCALVEGLDVVFLTAGGDRIERIVGFFDPLRARGD